jgi:hypothetical protein
VVQAAAEKGLIIAAPHIDRILAGRKTREMRNRQVRHRGAVALIKKGSGRVIGVAKIVRLQGAAPGRSSVEHGGMALDGPSYGPHFDAAGGSPGSCKMRGGLPRQFDTGIAKAR